MEITDFFLLMLGIKKKIDGKYRFIPDCGIHFNNSEECQNCYMLDVCKVKNEIVEYLNKKGGENE